MVNVMTTSGKNGAGPPSPARYSAVPKTRRYAPAGSCSGPRFLIRPSSSVRARAISAGPLPVTCSRRTSTPAAGTPRAVSSTCVVTMLMGAPPARRSRALQQLLQPDPVDLPEFAAHYAPLGAGVVSQPLGEQVQQLRPAAAARAHQVDVAEPPLVGLVAGGQALDRGRGGRAHPGLLLVRPAGRCAADHWVTDPRVAGQRLLQVG